ncbi:MAG: hypothetical protein HKN68_22715 [Saprospiraceae bacterium]|nr:hypothetical protein [Saprospiraceae bacterium]
MDIQEFKHLLKGSIPPDSVYLQALWLEKKGKWDEAHRLIDSVDSTDAAWIHAHLHRVEGDNWNARYWYSRAGKQTPNYDTTEEWIELVRYFCT